jgi:uncharacterized iron-regulated protein
MPHRFFGPTAWALALTAALASGCAAPTAPPTAFTPADAARLATLLPADALLLGEQHDAPEHQQLQRHAVDWLAAQGQLAALAIEMAEQGHDTAALPRHASEADVRAALAWSDAGWPWPVYAPVVMAAVRAGVPVLGANLPRTQLRAAMADTTLDARLPPAALQQQATRIREGHCDALPESQILPMTRVQIARDLAMADTVARARQPGRTVLLVAGNGHVHRALGVPLHLPADLTSKVLSALANQAETAIDLEANKPADAGADLLWPTPPRPPRDHCADFRRAVAPASAAAR